MDKKEFIRLLECMLLLKDNVNKIDLLTKYKFGKVLFKAEKLINLIENQKF